MHKNKVNGKVYIGQTYTSLKQRFGNGRYYSGCPIFYKAIKKYGWNNFEHILLEFDLKSQEAANAKEKYYIKKYKSTDVKYGYNISNGGKDGDNNLGVKVYQYDLNGYYIAEFSSIADAMRKFNISNGKITDCCKSKRKSVGGYMWSYNKFNKIDACKRNTNSKIVYQYSITGEFIKKYDTATSAASNLDGDSCNIVSCCNNNQSTAYGYRWSYEYLERLIPLSNITKNQTHDTTVIQLDKKGNIINKFSCVKEASNLFENPKRAYGAISQCLLHKTKFSYGYIWIFESEFESFSLSKYERNKTQKRAVKQIDMDGNTINVFKSLSDAAEYVTGKRATGNISKCLKNIYSSAYGYVWEYV